ncbi:MAG: hypothetical protein QOE90_2846 [Thermoplasmata archaeon]|jgi:hypothetical protein|nr:hypothetical protein [Thermoplasmata archaeon]
MLRGLLLAALLVPLGAAQNNATAPTIGNGNDGKPVGPTESTESAPGIAVGLLVLAGMLAFGAALAYASTHYARKR